MFADGRGAQMRLLESDVCGAFALSAGALSGQVVPVGMAVTTLAVQKLAVRPGREVVQSHLKYFVASGARSRYQDKRGFWGRRGAPGRRD